MPGSPGMGYQLNHLLLRGSMAVISYCLEQPEGRKCWGWGHVETLVAIALHGPIKYVT